MHISGSLEVPWLQHWKAQIDDVLLSNKVWAWDRRAFVRVVDDCRWRSPFGACNFGRAWVAVEKTYFRSTIYCSVCPELLSDGVSQAHPVQHGSQRKPRPCDEV